MSVRKIRKAWWVDFRHEHRRYRLRSPENSRAGAAAYEAVVRQRLARGEPVMAQQSPVVPTFAAFSEQWFQGYVVANTKPSTQAERAFVLRKHLVPALGHLKLDAVNGETIERYKAAKLKTGLSPKSINNHLVILAKCLRVAVEWGAMKTTPTVKALKASPPPFDFLSREEAVRLLHHAEPEWRDMLLVALGTGLRRGELRGLRWEDVDLEQRHFTVARSMWGSVSGTPKGNRVRHVPLTDDIHSALQKRPHIGPLVFGKRNGQPIDESTAAHAIKRQCERAGLRPVGWHTLRHTFASHLAGDGVPLHVVQQLLGHSSVLMTMRYAHLAPTALHEAIRTLEVGNRRATALPERLVTAMTEAGNAA